MIRRSFNRRSRLTWCKPLSWRTPPGSITALASFPGSGNTWIRYLLQQATGMFTGSVYNDKALLKNGFPAEFVTNGSVLVVKTHEWGSEVRNQFSKAILVIRDPQSSILAEFNRQNGGHIGHASSDKYKEDDGRVWNSFVMRKGLSWVNTTLDWLKFEGALHIVLYQNLLTNLEEEVKNILRFLDLPFSQNDITCMLENKSGIYKRKKWELNFDPYTNNQKVFVEKCRLVVNEQLKILNLFLSGPP